MFFWYAPKNEVHKTLYFNEKENKVMIEPTLDLLDRPAHLTIIIIKHTTVDLHHIVTVNL